MASPLVNYIRQKSGNYRQRLKAMEYLGCKQSLRYAEIKGRLHELESLYNHMANNFRTQIISGNQV